MKRKQQFIKAFCLMYPWYEYQEMCEYVYQVWDTLPAPRAKPDNRKHGRHCLRWLLTADVDSMSGHIWLSDLVGNN